MAMNLTKLANAEYTLQDIQEALDADGATVGTGPSGYYTAKGNPPGRWIGSGAKLLGGSVGRTASSKTVRSLINDSRDPSTGRFLGDVKLTKGDDGEPPVAGWDYTTRQPKSVSILWAFGDAETRRGIDECLQKATDMTIAYLEDEYASTRAGQGGVASVACDGVAGFVFDHFDTRDGDPQPHKHITISNRVRRSSDGVWTALDGRKLYSSMVEISEIHENLLQDLLTQRFGWTWTTKVNEQGTKSVINEVDGVPAELIEAFSGRHSEIAKQVEQRVQQEEAQTGRPVSFQRRAQIDLEVWQATRKAKPEIQPSLAEKQRHWWKKLGQTAPDIDIRHVWDTVNSRKTSMLHIDSTCQEDISRLLLDQIADMSRTGKNGLQLERELVDLSYRNVSKGRTTWKKTNVRAEAERLLRSVRIDPEQRIIVANRIADLALARCVKLTPGRYRIPQDAKDSPTLTNGNGVSVFDDDKLDLYTSQEILDAEHYMIEQAGKPAVTGFTADEARIWLQGWNEHAGRNGGYPLAADQFEAAVYALSNPRMVGAVIGPAGTGKTTTMRAVADAWRAKYGPDSVLGLATSRRAVGELRNSIGCNSITIAKLLYHNDIDQIERHRRDIAVLDQQIRSTPDPVQRLACRMRLSRILAEESTYSIRPNQLVIIDEAGMVDTRHMAQVSRMAELMGAKVTLTGDPLQLDSVSGAGGMLGWMERHGMYQMLSSLWRFTSEADKWDGDPHGGRDSIRRWEGEGRATLELRKGGDRADPESVASCERLVQRYVDHDRLHWGEDVQLEEESYVQCIEWQDQGKSTLLIAGTRDQVRDINRRFILERRSKGQSEADPAKTVALRDGLDVGRGDQIVCRKNEDDITSHDGRTIENGMTFRIENVGRRDVSCVSLADGSRWEIPREFLETGCEAGYACTVHRCQGMTVDRCAVLFPSDANTPCNLQYVAGSRGKEENHFYYACPDEEQRKVRHQLSGVETDPKAIAMSRMKAGLLNHPDAATATETLERERTDRMDLKRLMREHDYAAGLISGPHLNAMLARRHDPKTVDKITRSPSYEWLRGVWSRAYMTDAKRALAIIGQPLDPDRLKGRRPDRDQLVGKIARTARVLHPDRMDDTTYRIDMDVSRDSEQARYVTEILERSDIPYALADTLDGKAITIDVDHSCIPAVKTILDGLCQTVKGFDQSLFPQWRELRREEGRILKENPDMRRQSRPVEPDWAATIAGRLNAGLLDRVNGTVHEEWCTGVIPRIRASRHGSELDIVRQNERLIKLKVDELVRDAQASNQPWTGRILEASADDPTLFRDVVVYRAMWQVDEEDDPLGERPPASSGRQEQHWANLDGRINHTDGVVNPGRRHRPSANQDMSAINHAEETSTRPEETTAWQPSREPSDKPRNGLRI